MNLRIDKLLAHSGFGTRKEVKQLIKAKAVYLNGQVVNTPKIHVNEAEDKIEVYGQEVSYQEFVYYMLNKPQEVISATEDDFHETVVDLLEPSDIVQEPHPIGRLDIDTEGLLILTNDGKLTHQLTSPKHHVDKVYWAEVSGLVTDKDMKRFSDGVLLDDGYKALPAQLELVDQDEQSFNSWVKVTVQEGKFHQVKRMFESVGKQVNYLKRLSRGPLMLDPQLEPGAYRELTPDEIERLKNA